MKNKKIKWKTVLTRENVVKIVCPYCFKPILDPRNLTIEHEPPKSRQKELGKKSETFYACRECNNKKGALTAEEFEEWKRLEAIRNGCQKQR